MTQLVFRYGFGTRWRPLRALLNPLIRWIISRSISDRLRGLDKAAESTDNLSELLGAIPSEDRGLS